MGVLLNDSEMKDYIRRLQISSYTFGNSSDVDDEILEYILYLRFKEISRIPYVCRSPQRPMRDYIIPYILRVAEREALSYSTVSLAVYIFDRFFDSHTIDRKQLHLVAISCLILAGKMEERDTNTPRVKYMAKYVPKDAPFSFRLYTTIESYIIRFFNWNLMIPTIYTFLECFNLFALDGITYAQTNPIQDEHLNEIQPIRRSDNTDAGFKIRDYSFYILNCLLLVEPRDQFSPSCVAAAILMYSRRRHGYNFWTLQLARVTGCQHWDIIDCLEKYIDFVVPNDYSTGELVRPYFLAR